MRTLFIQSKGEIDINALSLMGASVKDEGAIGEFGSGLKYAIATILRNGLKFRVFSGPREIKIEKRAANFRGESFDVIWIEGNRTSITTRTGPKWTVADAVREIWSNALDEGEAEKFVVGDSMHTENYPTKSAGTSTFAIEINKEIDRMLQNWSQYFCADEPAIYENHYGRILDLPVQNYYRKGVWIVEDRNAIGRFSYDFNSINLPESRRVASQHANYHLSEILAFCDSEEIFSELLRHPEAKEWYSLSYNLISSRAADAIKKAFFKNYEYIGRASNKDRISPPFKVFWCEDNIHNTLAKISGIKSIEEHLKVSDMYDRKPWPIGMEARVDNAIARLASVQIDLTTFDITYGEFKTQDAEKVIAMADISNATCVLGPLAISSDDDMLLKALIEEWTHLHHNVRDGSVQQQHVYLDTILALIKGKRPERLPKAIETREEETPF